MSETTPNGGRSRRRASRHAGPPVEERHETETRDSAATGAATPVAGGSEAGVAGDDTTVRLDSAPTVKWATADVGDAESSGKSESSGSADASGRAGSSGVESVSGTTVSGSGDSAADTVVVSAGAVGNDTASGRDDAVAAGDAAGSDGRGPGTLGKLGWTAAAAAVLALVVLLGSGGFFFYHQHQADAVAERRADYVQTAKQAVLNLTHISDDTAPQDIDRVLSVASGELKDEYSQRKDAYAQVVQQAKVKASGEIIEAAIESQDDSTARVLVAAKQTLTNAGTQQPQDRYYRFRVTVIHDDHGTTASQVEFVA
ncbi:hypothetical protein [Nocardia sp. BMG51109]|uniref:hypothetical protein n=1 Tax=Nocardia sp. BMG51109 TaxID=1056816 RepID=UPI0004671378|nr:hypothetical protein [Nocardia sp. BMG51109]